MSGTPPPGGAPAPTTPGTAQPVAPPPPPPQANVPTAAPRVTRRTTRLQATIAAGPGQPVQVPHPPPPVAVNPTAPNAPGQAQPTVTFAMAPARATTDLLDYSQKAGKDQYYKATAPLSSKEENYDCSPDGLTNFLQLLERRALEMGWDDSILSVPDDVNNLAGSSKDFLTYYGSYTMEHLTQVAGLYHPLKNNRATQESFQLWNCLMVSITKEARDKVTVRKTEYTIDGECCGILLLKIIISKASVDTNASMAAVRMQLATLDRYIKTVDYDIGVFNHHVETLLARLVSRHQSTHDLLVNLFIAYKTVDDQEFHRYINQKESDYEESTQANVLTPEKLMSMAFEKFTILKEVKKTWREMTAEQKQIVALNARLEKSSKSPNKKENAKHSKKDDKKSGKKGAKSKTGSAKDARKDLPWLTDAPKSGDPTTKTVDGREWHFCSKHKKWGAHKSSDCKGHGLDTDSGQSKIPSSESGTEKKKSKANPRLVQAKKATLRFSDLAEESSDEE
jgi:hypothetical protein